jgi:hypothetical protein
MDASLPQTNPFRSPHWRADRVTQLLCRGPKPLPPRRYDDRYVRIYRKFMCEYSQPDWDEERQQSLALSMPDAYDAHLLHFGPDRELRNMLQARLLSGESLAEIARRFELAPDVVDIYEKVFFNVLDRLESRDWIVKVIKDDREPSDTCGSGALTDSQRWRQYRLFAYFGGPLVLDALIAALSPIRASLAADEFDRRFDDSIRQVIRSQATLASCLLEPCSGDSMRLLKLWQRGQRDISKSRAGPTSPPVDVSKNIEVFLTQLPKYLGPTG